MRAREFTEALNRPYYLHWEHSTDGDVSAVGYVVNGVKKSMDTDRMELALYKWASRELVDVEQALEDHGFRDIADLADHIEQHNGNYVPPSDFGLGNLGRGVAEHNLQELGTSQ